MPWAGMREGDIEHFFREKDAEFIKAGGEPNYVGLKNPRYTYIPEQWGQVTVGPVVLNFLNQVFEDPPFG